MPLLVYLVAVFNLAVKAVAKGAPKGPYCRAKFPSLSGLNSCTVLFTPGASWSFRTCGLAYCILWRIFILQAVSACNTTAHV